jgi:hypothetical protein
MARPQLSTYFEGIASKQLSAVEAHPERSNQHEFNGDSGLRSMLGPDKQRFPTQFIYLGEDEDETLVAEGIVTWYDARDNDPIRSEYRLYFPATSVSEAAAEGDRVVFGKRTDGTIMVIVALAGSTAENQLIWLFGLKAPVNGFDVHRIDAESDLEFGFAARQILRQLGIDPQVEPDDFYLDEMLRRFNQQFPTTKAFSAFARETLRDTSSLDGPDDAIIAWMEREEALFRTLEHYLITLRLEAGFVDVDSFISYSLGVQNRRKARAGHALENHLEHAFGEHGLVFKRNGRTENKSKPDFIFPGEEAYHDPMFPVEELAMLGVKRTCKDRWRQVLAEAEKIPLKHLLTLEPGISEHQTREMKTKMLQLVVPKPIHPTYNEAQQKWLMSITSFIKYVHGRRQGP